MDLFKKRIKKGSSRRKNGSKQIRKGSTSNEFTDEDEKLRCLSPKQQKGVPRVFCDKKNDKKNQKEKDMSKRAVGFSYKTALVYIPKDDEITPGQRLQQTNFVQDVVRMGVAGLLKDFNDHVRAYVGQPVSRKAFDSNPKKNRYKDVVCNDETRVVLRDGRPGDYVHANYVRGVFSPAILTQGPLKETLFDFWRLVVQEKPGVICMLCKTMENNKLKCVQYWPLKEGENFIVGDFTILSRKFGGDEHHSTCILDVFCEGTKVLVVRHIQLLSWPDKSVPRSNREILRVLHMLRSLNEPVIVHCSAGIGRTGTLIAAEACIQTLINEKPLILHDTVRALRDFRLSCVQVDVQYLCLASMVVDFGRLMKFWGGRGHEELTKQVEVFSEAARQYVQSHPPGYRENKLTLASIEVSDRADVEKPAVEMSKGMRQPQKIVCPYTNLSEGTFSCIGRPPLQISSRSCKFYDLDLLNTE